MLTERQIEVLKAIVRYIDANNISPTNRNLCHLVDLKSPSTIHSHLDKLEQEGCITKKDSIPRSITVTERGKQVLNEMG